MNNKLYEWQQLQRFPLGECSKHTLLYYDDSLWVFGGIENSQNKTDPFWKFHIPTNKWIHPKTTGRSPTARCHHSAVLWNNDKMLIFGGSCASTMNHTNELYEFNFTLSNWSMWMPGINNQIRTIRANEEILIPKPRIAHAAVVYNDRMWIFGGFDGNLKLKDMWHFGLSENLTSSMRNESNGNMNLTNNINELSSITSFQSNRLFKWSEVDQKGSIPRPLLHMAMCVLKDALYLFSGQGGTHTNNYLYQFNFESHTWTCINFSFLLSINSSPPSKRYGHSMTAFYQYLYIFGGTMGDKPFNDLVRLDTESMSWRTEQCAVSPRGRLFHAAACSEDSLFILGGSFNSKQFSNELFRISLDRYPACSLRRDLLSLWHQAPLGCDLRLWLAGTDCTNTCQPQLSGPWFYAHISVVAARCSVIRQFILQAKSAGNYSREHPFLLEVQLPLQPEAADAFSYILYFLYTDTIMAVAEPHVFLPYLSEPGALALTRDFDSSVSVQVNVLLRLISVYHLSLKFELRQIGKLFFEFFDTVLSIDNVLPALQAAYDLQISDLKNRCVRFIIKETHYSKVLHSAEFENLSKALILDIVRSHNHLSVFSPPTSPVNALAGHTCTSSLEDDLWGLMENEFGRCLSDITLQLVTADSGLSLSRDECVSVPGGGTTDWSRSSPSVAFFCHKSILAARSGYFRALFRVQSASGQCPVSEGEDDCDRRNSGRGGGNLVVHIDGIGPTAASPTGEDQSGQTTTLSIQSELWPAMPPTAFRLLLEYVYADRVCFSSAGDAHTAIFLFSTPQYYDFSNMRLQALCNEYLERTICAENCLNILLTANQCKVKAIQDFALSVIGQDEFRSLCFVSEEEMISWPKDLLVDITQRLLKSGGKSAGSLTTSCSSFCSQGSQQAPQQLQQQQQPPHHKHSQQQISKLYRSSKKRESNSVHNHGSQCGSEEAAVVVLRSPLECRCTSSSTTEEQSHFDFNHSFFPR